MTIDPERVKDNATWRREHQGHEIIEEEDRYPFEGGGAKVLRWWRCKPCGKRHLYLMETIDG